MVQTVLNILAEAATDQIRNETYQGREYLVVPVIALVEGVLHSANAADPELALASEFGKFPNAWDGRPLVMNHPKVNDQYVSANSPQVLEEWSFGMLFNTHMDGNKLKTEAWIDIAKANALGGEVLETVERIQSGEVVEVSTGLFASVEETPGAFNGMNYAGVWRSVTPDHLAFLSAGTIGACSVENGCGVPRINMFRHVKPQSHDCGCGCGGTCNEGEPAVADKSTETPTVSEDVVGMFAQLGVNSIPDIEPELLDKVNARQEKMATRLNMIFPNSLPSDMPFENAQKLVRNALMETGDVFTIYTMTSDHVVYEDWDSYDLWQRSYSINADGSQVTLGEEKTKVNLLTKVVPVVNASDDMPEDDEEDDDTPKTNETETTQGDPDMSQNDNADVNDTTGDVSADTQTQTQADPQVNAAPKVLTVQEYIAAAPEGVQEMLNESMRLHTEKKDRIVSNLKANERCDYSEDELRAMSLPNLERLSKLANVPTYIGGSSPRTNAAEENQAPKPLQAFPAPTPDANSAS